MRPITGLVLGVAALASAGGLQVLAGPALTTKYEYFKVSGDTPAEVYVSILKHGPHINNLEGFASTVTKMAEHGKPVLENGCRIPGYRVYADFTINLPKLTDRGALSPTALARWRQFTVFLRKHEETHRAIWTGCANTIQSKVSALRGRTCEELGKRKQAIIAEARQACTRKDAAFDAAEQKRVNQQPFMRMVLAPLDNPVKGKSRKLAPKTRKQAAN